jgi:photosynthetic reaction center H subunit
MPTGAITGHIDVAQVVLYAFWIFFFGLVIYLRRENRREGFPIIGDDGVPEHPGYFVGIPSAKEFRLHDRNVYIPMDSADKRPVKGVPTGPWAGSPLEPTGSNPMLDSIGPGSYSERVDLPEVNLHGAPKIVPLRVANDYYLEPSDPDPRGMDVIGADKRIAGKVVEVWIDRAEFMARYLEVELDGDTGIGPVLIPMTMAEINGTRKYVYVDSILSTQFAQVPRLKSSEQITLLEEEMVTAYYGAGTLYAKPARKEPLI